MPRSVTGKTEDRLATSEVREDFADTINKVCFGRHRIILHRRGKNLAAMVPMEDFMLLKSLEDRYDLSEARAILANAEAKRERTISWDKIKEDLNLLPIKERRDRGIKGEVSRRGAPKRVGSLRTG
jgi:PHD/YefM family antitoxin component YafN of YafNO toxin-antitoxin module